MPYDINSHVLTRTNSCINKAIRVLLMHFFFTLRNTVPVVVTNTNVIHSNVHSSEHNLLIHRLGFQNHPWDPADVNAMKITFDPYI